METAVETINTLLDTKEIPSLEGEKIASMQKYLFHSADTPLRIQVAETVFRHNHNHPSAFDLFLACTLPLAETMARRQAEKLFAHPSDITIEFMYDGAVNAAIKMFQTETATHLTNFRRALYRSLHCGALQTFFNREENTRVISVASCEIAQACRHRGNRRNAVEEQIISRELLDKIAKLKNGPNNGRRILQCILELGPDAVKLRSRRDPQGDIRRPLIDAIAVGEAMGIKRHTVDKYLGQARAILRETFNPDGTLFMRKR